MPLFVLAVLAAGMLIGAALTFSFCAAIPALHRFAITAPAVSLVVTPIALLLLLQAETLTHHMFVVQNNGPIRTSLVSLCEALVVALFVSLAWAFALFCRAVLEYGPPLLGSTLEIQPLLILQTVLLIGSLASAVVNFTFFATLMHTFKDQRALAISIAFIGLLMTTISLTPLKNLRTPERYSPKPLPIWLKKILFSKT